MRFLFTSGNHVQKLNFWASLLVGGMAALFFVAASYGVSQKMEGYLLSAYNPLQQMTEIRTFWWVYIRELLGWLDLNILGYRLASLIAVTCSFVLFSLLTWVWVKKYILTDKGDLLTYILFSMLSALCFHTELLIVIGYDSLNISCFMLAVGFLIRGVMSNGVWKSLSLVLSGIFYSSLFFIKITTFVAITPFILLILFNYQRGKSNIGYIAIGMVINALIVAVWLDSYSSLSIFDGYLNGYMAHIEDSNMHGWDRVVIRQYEKLIDLGGSILYFLLPLIFSGIFLSDMFSKDPKTFKRMGLIYLALIFSVFLHFNSPSPLGYHAGQVYFGLLVIVIAFVYGGRVSSYFREKNPTLIFLFGLLLVVFSLLYMLGETIYSSVLYYKYFISFISFILFCVSFLVWLVFQSIQVRRQVVVLVFFLFAPLIVTFGSDVLFLKRNDTVIWLPLLLILLLKWKHFNRESVHSSGYVIAMASLFLYMSFSMTYRLVVSAPLYPTTLIRQDRVVSGVPNFSGQKVDKETKFFFEELYSVVTDNLSLHHNKSVLLSSATPIVNYALGGRMPYNLIFLAPSARYCQNIRSELGEYYPLIVSLYEGRDMEVCIQSLGAKFEDYLVVAKLTWPYHSKKQIAGKRHATVMIHKDSFKAP